MHIILTLDKQNGMMFNHRRQSRDRVMMAHLLALVGDGNLWMNAYSAKLFSGGIPANVKVAEDFLIRAGEGDFCFVEDAGLAGAEDRIQTVYVYRWNENYPADQILDLNLECRRQKMIEKFAGSSHDKITLECYEPLSSSEK